MKFFQPDTLSIARIEEPGVMLAVKNTIPSCIMTSPPDLEALSVNIGGNNPTAFCKVYTPPSSTD